eukprot:Lithocolla_globosa_v1_NODE_113_length_6217_cov_73.628043.p5 type:complete len:159 gc:universal NODE_113_length_6217_cov_73.628043:2086-2562(+)
MSDIPVPKPRVRFTCTRCLLHQLRKEYPIIKRTRSPICQTCLDSRPCSINRDNCNFGLFGFDPLVNHGYIYIVKKPFTEYDEYKIGKTSNIVSRLSWYPTGTKLIFLNECHNPLTITETNILRELKAKFDYASRESIYIEDDDDMSTVKNIILQHCAP